MIPLRKVIVEQQIYITDFMVYETVVYSVRHKFYENFSALRVARDNTLKVVDVIRSELKKYETL